MAILHKRNAITSTAPTTGQLALGELAINTYDGKIYIKKDDGAESIIEIAGGGTSEDLGEFLFASLPPANLNANKYALVTNATTPTAGRVVVRSDGTDWKFIAAEGATVA